MWNRCDKWTDVTNEQMWQMNSCIIAMSLMKETFSKYKQTYNKNITEQTLFFYILEHYIKIHDKSTSPRIVNIKPFVIFIC